MSIFLDSGAFSAFTKKVKINIDEYIDFIKKHERYIDVYANLDVIGDADATLENQKYMESKGLNPLPVFHTLYEPFDYLVYLLDKGYSYICLGGMATGVDRETLITKLDISFSEYICDKETGFPKVKVHGFGLTSVDLLIRYPWFSVDSTSWVLTSRFGCIYVPVWKNGKWDYLQTPDKINFSSRPSKPDRYNYNNGIGNIYKQRIDQYLQEKGFIVGKSEFDSEGKEIVIEKGLINDYKHRDIANIIYFQDLQKALPEWPWSFKLENKVEGFF